MILRHVTSFILSCLLLVEILAAAAIAKPTTTSVVPEPTPSTIVDFLSSDVQYSYFLRHLQRNGLIPLVNGLENVTLMAPVNLAFVDGELAAHDNKENLLRYFADQRLRIGYLDTRDVVYNSLFVTKHAKLHDITYPLKLLSLTASETYYVNDFAEIVDFDGYAKHQRSFIQAIDRLLPLLPSMCDVLMDKTTYQINGHSVAFFKLLFQLLFTQFHKKEVVLLCEDFLAGAVTIFIPTDAFISLSMLSLQERYYTALFHAISNEALRTTRDAAKEIKADISALLLHFILPDLVGGVNGTSGHKLHKTVTKSNSYNITLVGNKQICINGEVFSAQNSSAMTANDGLMYVLDFNVENGQKGVNSTQASSSVSLFSSLNIPLANMIPRKTLFAIHFSDFVKELKFRKLGYLIDGSTTNQTIILDSLARDDVPDEEISTQVFSNKQGMLYRFLEGAIDMTEELSADSPTYDRLLTSKLCLKKRIGSCYKVKISGSIGDDKQIAMTFNDELKVSPEPIRASGNNTIYVTDQDFLTPSLFKHTMAELISNGVVKKHLSHINIDKKECLKTMGYLNEFKMASLDENQKGYSVFLPCGNTIWEHGKDLSEQDFGSWKGLGLILKYLETHPKVMEKVLMGLFVEDLVYSDFGLEDNVKTSRIAKTLGGDTINITEKFRSGDYNHLIKLNDTPISVPLNSDVLFNQGVIHITSKLILPDDFQVSLIDLIRATDQDGYEKFSFTNLLDEFPKLSDALGLDGKRHSNYSLLVPSPDSLKLFNITQDFSRLAEFLELHLLPNLEVDTLLRCLRHGEPAFGPDLNATYSIRTNRSGAVFSCHKNILTGKTFLLLQNVGPLTGSRKSPAFSGLVSALGYNADHQVRIVSHGCSRTNRQSEPCVFLLEKPLSLSWFDSPDNFLRVHIGWISVAIGVIIGVILFGFLTTTLVVCLSATSKTKKPTLLSPESIFAPTESTYMRVTSDEDTTNGYYDYGYETDDDMVRNERDQLLPVGRKKRNVQYYDSMLLPIGAPSAPRSIKNGGIKTALNRERNLPPLNI